MPLARTGMHYHRRPFFRKKPRIGCPANLLENDFPPGYLFCQPFISQNLRIILLITTGVDAETIS